MAIEVDVSVAHRERVTHLRTVPLPCHAGAMDDAAHRREQMCRIVQSVFGTLTNRDEDYDDAAFRTKG